MRANKIKNLQNLSKEQLIGIIQIYEHAQFVISETLVNVSKCNITSDVGIEKIRKYLNENQIDLANDNLEEYTNKIIFQSGKENVK